MKCIITKRTYGRGTQLLHEELIAESADRTEVIHVLNKLTLTIDEGGSYRITNGTGGTVRQGQAEDNPASIFEVYDSCTFPVGPLELETPTYSGSFEDYEQLHGFGRIPRDIKTKWRVYTETLPEDTEETAIGLLRYDGQKTYEIHSLYIPKRLSRREKSEFIREYVDDRLKASEFATIHGNNIKALRSEHISIAGESYKHRFEQARLLYVDAMDRKASISEVIPDGAHYQSQEIFKEDEKEARGIDGREVIHAGGSK